MSGTPGHKPLRVVILISGGGTTLRNLLEKIAASRLDVEIPLVISSSAKARGLDIAAEAGIRTLALAPKLHASPDAYQRRGV